MLENAARGGAIDRVSTLKEVREADLVVLAAPISRVTDLVGDLTPTDALITDVASAKGAIVRRAEDLRLRFVGGHPMAGSQLSGVANASANLFEGARYFLTPTGSTDPEDYREVAGFVRELGAVPTAVDPEKHDLLMAALSHLPHLMAAALLKVASDISPEALSFAGPSFRDLTRVGASNPELWSDILAENAPALGRSPGAFAGAMAQLGSEIKDREIMEGRFRQAREAYDALGGILVEKGGANVDVADPRREPPRRLRRGDDPHGLEQHQHPRPLRETLQHRKGSTGAYPGRRGSATSQRATAGRGFHRRASGLERYLYAQHSFGATASSKYADPSKRSKKSLIGLSSVFESPEEISAASSK